MCLQFKSAIRLEFNTTAKLHVVDQYAIDMLLTNRLWMGMQKKPEVKVPAKADAAEQDAADMLLIKEASKAKAKDEDAIMAKLCELVEPAKERFLKHVGRQPFMLDYPILMPLPEIGKFPWTDLQQADATTSPGKSDKVRSYDSIVGFGIVGHENPCVGTYRSPVCYAEDPLPPCLLLLACRPMHMLTPSNKLE